MKKQLFSISDSRVGAHNPPFAALNQQEAEALWFRSVNDPLRRTPQSEFPDDFDLWLIGTFDTDTGLVESLETPKHVSKAAHVRQPQV